MIELKDILKHLRDEKQVSMDKMCEDLNNLYNVSLAKSTISKWENGKAEPSLSYARILTKYFNVSLDYLLGLENSYSYSFSNSTSSLSKDESKLIFNFNKLNDLGKTEANKRVAELTEISKYTLSNEVCATFMNSEKDSSHLLPIAAHSKEGIFTEEDYQHDMDIMNNDDIWK